MSDQKNLSLLDVLQKSSDFLRKHHVEQPRLNAEHLIAHVLKIARLELYLQFERELTEIEYSPLRDLIKQRSQGIPLQHLLGTAEFFGRTFDCDKRALIPRPETEQLVERALTYQNINRILDVGTGSGVIAVTLALEKNSSSISAIDLSEEALILAKKNAERHQVTHIRWHHGDLFSALSSPKDTFDLIVANLPYIPTNEITTLSREVQNDPIMALDGGTDGLDFIRLLIEKAPDYLAKGGRLLLEIGKDQDAMVIDLLEKNHYQEILSLSDYQGIRRFVEARLI